MHANFSKSDLFDESSGTRSKNGMTDSRSAARSRTTNTAIALAVPLDVATPEALPDDLQDLSSVTVLAYVELRNELESDATAASPLDGNGKRALSVDVAGDTTRRKREGRLAAALKIIGGYLLSREVALRVPSAQAGLTSLFGMGRGVSPPL